MQSSEKVQGFSSQKSKFRLQGIFSDYVSKEINMSNKVVLKVLVAFGLLAAVLLFLAIQFVPGTSALAPAKSDSMTAASLVGSDWIERHPSNVSAEASLAGSDWIERHPAGLRLNYYTGSDWIERHPSVAKDATYYAGSDWIERHPSAVTAAGSLAGSDYIERHPSNRYVGSDWIERQPAK
jgi:hypothetical protein